MRRIITTALVLLGVCAGCGRDVTPSATSSSSRHVAPAVEIVSVSHSINPRVIEADVRVNEARRTLKVSAPPTLAFGAGLDAELRDLDDEPLARVTVSWDPDTFSQMQIVESAAGNQMTITWRRAGNRIYETYEIEGQVLELTYPILRPVVRSRIASDYLQGKSFNHESAEVQEYAAAIASFDAFYAPYAHNALQDNVDGEALVVLLTDEFTPAFAPPGYQPQVSEKIQNFCTLVGLCALVKCIIVPNLLCVPCSGASYACVLFSMACWIMDC